MQTPILFFVALALFWTAFASFLATPAPPVAPAEKQFFDLLAEAENNEIDPIRWQQIIGEVMVIKSRQ